MLSIFDQALIDSTTRHVLHIREEDYPEEFRPIVRRLLQAIAEKEVRTRMTVEDRELVSELESRDRTIADLGEKVGKAEERAGKAEAEVEEERDRKRKL